MEEHAEIVPIDPQLGADLVFVSVLEEQPAQEVLFFLRQGRQCVLNACPLIRRHHSRLDRGPRFVRRINLVRQRVGARSCPVLLEEHVVAHTVHEGPEVFGGLQAAPLLQRRQDASERFLPRVFRLRWRPQTRPQFDGEQSPKYLANAARSRDHRPPAAPRTPDRSRNGPASRPKSYFIPIVAAEARTLHLPAPVTVWGYRVTSDRTPECGVDPMLDHMTSDSLSASFLLRSLTTNEHHPHLLLDCNQIEVECVLLGLTQWGRAPLTHCRLPGPLIVPRSRARHAAPRGIAALNLSQQLALFDWMTHRASERADHLDYLSRHRFALVAQGRVSRRPAFPAQRRSARHPGL